MVMFQIRAICSLNLHTLTSEPCQSQATKKNHAVTSITKNDLVTFQLGIWQ